MRTETKFLTAALFLLMCVSVVLGVYPETLTQVVTDGGQSYTLQMQKVSIRGTDFNVKVQNDTGGYDDITASVNPVGTYLGTVDEDPSASAAGVLLSNGVFRSVIYIDTGRTVYADDDAVTAVSGTATPVWAFPTTATVQPGQAGDTVYTYQQGVDIDYSVYSQYYGSDPLYTVEMVEFNTLAVAMTHLRCAKQITTVGRLIIRASASQTPYDPALGNSNLGPLSTEWTNNHADARLYCFRYCLAIPSYGGGVANGTFSVNGTASNGRYLTVWRHEHGHNWGIADYDGGSPEGRTVMCGNSYWHHCGTGINDILRKRESNLSGGKIADIGVFSVVDIPPHAALDAVVTSQGVPVVIDVLANDYDANNDSIDLLSFDGISENGGLVTFSAGTGPGGRDELQYMPAGTLGFDTFAYQIVDSTGQTKTGRVHTMVEEFASETYEAEDAVLSGAVVKSNASGYTGTGFADYVNSSGDYVEWTINAAEAGDADLSFRYALDVGDRPLEIKVNGQVEDPGLSFPATGGWSSWGFTGNLRVSLNAGTNTVRATAIGSSGANIDYLKVINTIDTSGPQDPYFYYDPTVKPKIKAEAAYSDTLADSANDPDLNETLTFSKLSGPTWLNVAADGTLSGIPTVGDIGLNSFSVRVTDSTSRTDDATLEIDVLDSSTLYLHLTADSLALADGAAVTSWTDSVNGNTLTGNATYVADYANGHASVAFDGIDDMLQDVTLAGTTPNTGNMTLFVVGQFATQTYSYLVSAQNGAVDSGDNRFRIRHGGTWLTRVGDGGNKYGTKGDEDLHVFSLVSGQDGTNATRLDVDGTLATNGDHGTTANCANLNRLNLGAFDNDGTGTPNGFLHGFIAEVLIYDGALTNEQIADVETSLMVKYGVTEAPGPLDDPGHVKVFLLGGQSNMDGRAPASGLPTSPVNLQEPQTDVLLYHGDANGYSYLPGNVWCYLAPGSGSQITAPIQFGPEVTFGRAMADAYPNERFALIKYAKGGSNLENNWDPLTGDRYALFQDTVAAGLADLVDAGFTYEIVGMLWMQGESDKTTEMANAYEANLTALIADVRTRYGANLPFVAGETWRNEGDASHPGTLGDIVSGAQQAVADNDPYAGFVPTRTFTWMDEFHFDAIGQMDLGNGFAGAMQQISPFKPTWTANPLTVYDAWEGYDYSNNLDDFVMAFDAGAISFFKVSSQPIWLTVNANGTLSGIPSDKDVGMNSLTVRATDSQGVASDVTLNITVLNTFTGELGFPDFAGLAMHWLDGDCMDIPPCGGADLTGEGLVDIDDLRRFSELWLIQE